MKELYAEIKRFLQKSKEVLLNENGAVKKTTEIDREEYVVLIRKSQKITGMLDQVYLGD